MARLVGGVVAEAVRDAGAAGVVLAAPDGPERRLLVRWLAGEGAVRAAVPSDPDVARVRAALAEGRPPGVPLRAEAARAVARALALERGLLVAGVETRTVLVLRGGRPPDPLLPLGDVPASAVRRWAGGAGLPGEVLRALGVEILDGEALEAVDRVLERWLDRGRPLDEALGSAPPHLAAALERLLRRGLAYGRPALVPKLGRWTAGTDPPP